MMVISRKVWYNGAMGVFQKQMSKKMSDKMSDTLSEMNVIYSEGKNKGTKYYLA